MVQRPPRQQYAALCYRTKNNGEIEVLVATSRDTGRWVIPKGWPMSGRSMAEAALQEAWEEAGVTRGKASRKPLGRYIAIKRTPAGDDLPCLHRVYAVKVQEAVDDYPEAHRRDRIWVTPEQAARLVDEDGLREILTGLRRLL